MVARTANITSMRRVFSRTNRYMAAVGSLALVGVLLMGLSIPATAAEHSRIDADAARLKTLQEWGYHLADAVRDQEAALYVYLLTRDEPALQEYRDAVDVQGRASEFLRAQAAALPDILEAIDRIDAFAVDLRSDLADPLIAALESGNEAAIPELLSVARIDHEAIDDVIHPLDHELLVALEALRLRTADLASTRSTTTIAGMAGLLIAALVALALIRRYGRRLEQDALHASILNRFTEVTALAAEDSEIAESNLVALGLLTKPDASVTHILNRSKDRAAPEATTGDAVAEVLPLNGLTRCVGIIRGSMYVVDDAAAPLSVHCPVYPARIGTVACVPLISGETVGSVHLYWTRPHGLPLALRPGVARIAEHAALAIGNRRLLAALQGQANTDPRTGLSNSRAFDSALEDALAARTDDESVSVLMLDLDRFKEFNDRFGHPAGDDALRVFADVLRSCLRDDDLAARYGGEEFTTLLRGVDGDAARTIAERIRARTESTVISLAPGQTARLTVSIGVASGPAQGTDRVTLLRLADQALYRAKELGRNRVEWLDATSPTSAPARPPRARGRLSGTEAASA